MILFRGVGGATQLPVAPLREALAAARFERVATFINSGNAVLASSLPPDAVAARVAALCAARFGFRKAVHVLTRDEWAALIAANPFPEATGAGKLLHAAVLAAEPAPEKVAALKALAGDVDRIEVVEKVAYLHTPNGFGTSKVAARFDKGIGVPNTARNWNTVLKLMEMVEAVDP